VTNNASSARRNLLAGLIIITAGAAGFAVFKMRSGEESATLAPVRAAADGGAPAESEPAEVPGEAPDAAAAPAAKSVPDSLPDITLADRDGKPTTLASFGGRPLMVNFWATWCAPCRREIPLLNRLREERKAQNAEIVGVAVDFREDVLKFEEKVPLKYPLLIGEEDGLAAAEAFGMGMAFPFSVFVDHQNRILTVKIGELHEDEANFAFDRLQDIAEGTLSREAAQEQVAEAFKQMAAARANHAH
jgi:thiol-disulfide isomerase/thioredoxin